MKSISSALALLVSASFVNAESVSYTIVDEIFAGGVATIGTSGLCKIPTQKFTDARLVRLQQSQSNREFLSLLTADNSIIALFDINQGEHLAREFTTQVSGSSKKANAKGVQSEHLVIAAETLIYLLNDYPLCFPEGRSNTHLFSDGEANSTLTINAKYVNGENTSGTAKQLIKASANHYDYGTTNYKTTRSSFKETIKKKKTLIKVTYSASAPYQD